MGKMTYWGSGRQEKRVFEITLFKFRLSLYKEVTTPRKESK